VPMIVVLPDAHAVPIPKKFLTESHLRESRCVREACGSKRHQSKTQARTPETALEHEPLLRTLRTSLQPNGNWWKSAWYFQNDPRFALTPSTMGQATTPSLLLSPSMSLKAVPDAFTWVKAGGSCSRRPGLTRISVKIP
jgi:hypothetical protein